MELIYEIIAKDPKYFTWGFGIVNVLWGVFLYFNTKRHQRELITLRQELDLDLERRRKVFEMKAGQYEDYFASMDAIHNKHKNDYHKIVVPLINEFNASYQLASVNGDAIGMTDASIKFSESISRITYDGFDEMQAMQSQTNKLRLTASDNVANKLDELQCLYEKLFQLSTKMVSDIVQVTMNGDHDLANENQLKLNELGELTKKRANELREQMRKDLNKI